MDKNLSIPVSETLSFLRFETKTKEFVKSVVERHHAGELGYELDFTDGQKIVIRDTNEICRGNVFPLGIYGFYKKPSDQDEKPEEVQDKNIYHWTWVWSLSEDHEFRSRFKDAGLKKIQELRDQLKKDVVPDDALSNTLDNLFNNANIFSEDSMINSYIESVLTERLSLDTVYNIAVDAENNIYLALGVTDIVWYSPAKTVDIVSTNEDDED